MARQKLITIAALAIVTIWIASSVKGLITDDYVGVTYSSPLMFAVAGYLFARDAYTKRRGENGNGNDN